MPAPKKKAMGLSCRARWSRRLVSVFCASCECSSMFTLCPRHYRRRLKGILEAACRAAIVRMVIEDSSPDRKVGQNCIQRWATQRWRRGFIAATQLRGRPRIVASPVPGELARSFAPLRRLSRLRRPAFAPLPTQVARARGSDRGLARAVPTAKTSTICDRKPIATANRLGVWSSQGWLATMEFGRRPDWSDSERECRWTVSDALVRTTQRSGTNVSEMHHCPSRAKNSALR